jgi:hypothetical protein
LQYAAFPKISGTSVAGIKRGRPSASNKRGMFAGDPAMQVTQDMNGIIRAKETNTQTDLLNVEVDHISFEDSKTSVQVGYDPNNHTRLLR